MSQSFIPKRVRNIKTTDSRPNTFRIVLTLVVFISFLSHSVKGQQTTQKSEEKWSFAVGLGSVVMPSYMGDDEYQLLLFPNFQATYSDKFFASFLDGIGYNIIKNEKWRIGGVIKTHIGRYEDGKVPGSVLGNETSDLAGLGDIDATLEPGFFVEYTKSTVSTKMELRRGIGGHKGLIGELKSEYKNTFKLFGNQVYYAIGPSMRFADSSFNNAFFGIDEHQASATDLAVYQSEFGLLSYGLNSTVVIPVNSRVSTVVFAGFSRLGSVATDSQLVKKYGSANQGLLGFMINYKL